MSNIFKIKHGWKKPTKENLSPYELGYCDDDKLLYIGKNNEEPTPVGIKLYFYDENGDGNITISTTNSNEN